MSNENKKAWISLVVPVVYVLLLLFFRERADNLIVLVLIFPVFLIIQFHLTKFLNRKFPSSKDLKDW